MTPHGLPPITPSMPSFTFLPQPSPGLPSPAAVEPDRPTMHGHMQHVMTPFSPFSPGVTMSPGAFWGRPGSGANPFINAAVGAPQQQQQQQQHPGQQQQQQQSQPGEHEGRPPDGYFPPVAVSMAMAQGGAMAHQEPAGYFPWVPPPAHGGDGQQQQQRTSGLANEILRDDSSSATAARPSSGPQEIKDSPSASDGTATTSRTGTEASTSGRVSSGGTSWHTGSEGAVEDTDGSPGEMVHMNGNGNGHGHGKPRAYSAETGTSSGTERGGLHRADSDPIRKALAEQQSS
ncbi:hypothetical protein OH77DRAFT_1503854 [Trametes cingulata]|nr:hypothetical protein OH77DRAFT_1503854 [Trametes cingulata]